MSLQAKLDAFKHEFETKMVPPAVVEALHRGVAELITAGAPGRALRAGARAPEFTLPDADGRTVDSQALLRSGPLVLTFYRGAWCPYCNLDLKALEELRPELESRGAKLVAVSQQNAVNSRKSQHDNGLGFPILVDHRGELAARFGLRWTMPAYLREVHAQLGVVLPTFNGEDSWTLPMPARYVIDQRGMIVYAEVDADYTHRPEPSDLLPVLDALRAAAT